MSKHITRKNTIDGKRITMQRRNVRRMQGETVFDIEAVARDVGAIVL